MFRAPNLKFRPESFGGIVASQRPAALIFVNRPLARWLGFSAALPPQPAPRPGPAGPSPTLSAPVEAHLTLTSRCGAGCPHCYTQSVPSPPPSRERPLEFWLKTLDSLSAMGVFHVALGGGESLELPFLLDVARHARARGIVPNLTTNGLHVTPAFAREARGLFGRVNVSFDGIGPRYAALRGADHSARALEGVRLLKKHGVETGFNVVVARQTFAGLAEVFATAAREGVRELELLRIKPAGRETAARFARDDLTPGQMRALYPAVRRLAARYLRRVRLDCSFTPAVAWHQPRPETMTRLGVVGCIGGDWLAGIKPDGQAAGCSFAHPDPEVPHAGLTAASWPRAFADFRSWTPQAPEPCRSCAYLAQCRGGCHAVAQATSTFFDPDPGCPYVHKYRRNMG